MRRILVQCIAAATISAAMFVARQAWNAPNPSLANAARAANSLGLSLAAFKGPEREVTSWLAAPSYHWERYESGAAVERLNYLGEDESLCWSVRVATGWKNNGCVNAVPPGH
jgi:hypothetical protein